MKSLFSSHLLRALSLLGVLAAYGAPASAAVPANFQETIVFSGLTQPTAVQFAGDGRVFVAEKSGLIKVFDSLERHDADRLRRPADERPQLLGPRPARPRAPPELPGRRPTSTCSTRSTRRSAARRRAGAPRARPPTTARRRPGDTDDGCVVGGRALAPHGLRQRHDRARAGPHRGLVPAVSRATRSASLAFGADGALYVSGGDGASFTFVDYGQRGMPRRTRAAIRRCAVGGTQTPPTAEGGALRSQDIRTDRRPAGLRRHRPPPRSDHRRGAARQPALRRRRSPTRRPHHRLRPPQPVPHDGAPGHERGLGRRRRLEHLGGDRPRRRPARRAISNFGWPCYEGVAAPGRLRRRQPRTSARTSTRRRGGGGAPYFAYHHADQVVAGETCATGSSSIAGLAFYDGGTYPPTYDGALFFADYSRNCIWAMFARRERAPGPGATAPPS